MALTFYYRLEGADLDESTSEQFQVARNTIKNEGAGCILYVNDEQDIRVVNCSFYNHDYEEQEWWDAFSFVMRDRASLEYGK